VIDVKDLLLRIALFRVECKIMASVWKIKHFIIGILICLIVLFRFVDHPHINVVDEIKVPHGSYGLSFATMPPKDKKRVILIGNSVFQATKLVPILVKLRNKLGYDFEIGNFGITGASIADYIIMYNYVKKYKPDVIIIHLAPITFGFTDLIFRTDSKKLLFLPEMKRLNNELILNNYTNDELIESYLYSHFPLFRTLPIIRARLKDLGNEYLNDSWNTRFMDFFPHTLNVVVNEDQFINKEYPHQRQFPEAQMLFEYFVEQLRQDDQKAVFIMQENNYKNLPICFELKNYLQRYKQFSFYNFRDYYHKDNFFDNIHPKNLEAINVADRLLNVILKTLP